MSGETLIFLVMGAGFVAYVLTGGADFGGGVWDLLASGPRKRPQREAVEQAIAPIWEANHVWLIFVIVVMFTVFPRAFAVLGTALHIPIALALVGIVMRGAAFTFRAYGLQPEPARERWGHVFAWSSALTPVFLGTTLAGVSSGAIRVTDGAVTTGFLAGWTTPFAWGVGLFTLALFALLAAVYLAREVTDPALADDFRRRALVAEGVAAALAAFVFWRASVDAPLLFERLSASPWTWPVQGATALAALTAIATLWTRRFGLARLAAATQVGLVVVGWGLAMGDWLIVPDVRLGDAGGRPEVIEALLPALAFGVALLAPSLWFLFRVFKRARPEPPG